MTKTFKERLQYVGEEIQLERWLTEMQGGKLYYAHSLMMEIEHDVELGVPGIRPNFLGCRLISLGRDVVFYSTLAAYLLFNREPAWFGYDLEAE